MTALKVFDRHYLATLVRRAQTVQRLRQHDNIHTSLKEPVQRLFNAIEPKSYIRPHRHRSDHRTELLVAVRGEMALIIFDEDGAVTEVHKLATESYGPRAVVAVELSPSTWHTVVALTRGCVLLEVKAGPFDPNQAKDLASWAPPEDDLGPATDYHDLLRAQIDRELNK